MNENTLSYYESQMKVLKENGVKLTKTQNDNLIASSALVSAYGEIDYAIAYLTNEKVREKARMLLDEIRELGNEIDEKYLEDVFFTKILLPDETTYLKRKYKN